jgi:hypothetical protein
MKKNLLILGIVLVVGLIAWLLRPRRPALEQACVAERRITVWSRLAQVREPVASLKFGDRVSVLERKAQPAERIEHVRIRTAQNAEGWVEARQLMPVMVLERAHALLQKSRGMTMQATGKTKVLTNIRAEAGRAAPRIFQFPSETDVEVFARTVSDRPSTPDAAAKEAAGDEAPVPELPKREDWYFIRGKDEEVGEMAGWVRASFIEPAVPVEMQAYAQGFRFVAWFELARVVDVPPPPDPARIRGRVTAPAASLGPIERPLYLGAGVIGGEGGPCDFTLIRFYSWNMERRRYETAYVESNFCGKFPIQVKPIPPGADFEKSEAAFSFLASTAKAGDEPREYRMKQNVIRRVRMKR